MCQLQHTSLGLQRDKGHLGCSSVHAMLLATPHCAVQGKLQRWLTALLRDKGTDIFRSKGVLSIKGQPDK